ncbi:lactonase family protein [Cellulomonas triticagri]|uniref:lactonase family protein n=1 Tax=Cellulomonas triticagri TaxID=2483352 RepID=UPI001F1E0A04|nr:lactonase family protein [Cellulomonas triticagri]
MTEHLRDLWIGTYPSAGAGTPAGRGEGVWRVSLDPETGRLTDPVLAATTPAPSFLAVDRRADLLLAVGEDAAGTVTAFRTAGTPGSRTLDPLGTVPSGGADPCHVLLDPSGRTAFVANYSSGTLVVLDRTDDPAAPLGDGPVQTFGHTGSGPVTERQEGPHAHHAALAPGGTHVLVCDLGTDEIRRYRRDPQTGRLTEAGVAATLRPGSGPRHLVFSADGRIAYVTCELDVTVAVLAWDVERATGHVVQHVPALEEGATPAGTPLPSHIDRVGDRVLVATRGPDVLATFAAAPDGTLAPAGQVALPGAWPRHFAVVEGCTVVADQVGDSLTVLRDGAVSHRVPLPAPACVVVA